MVKTKIQNLLDSLIVLSPDSLARRPSSLKLTLSTYLPWPDNVLMHSPVVKFQSLIVLSYEPLARRHSLLKLIFAANPKPTWKCPDTLPVQIFQIDCVILWGTGKKALITKTNALRRVTRDALWRGIWGHPWIYVLLGWLGRGWRVCRCSWNFWVCWLVLWLSFVNLCFINFICKI